MAAHYPTGAKSYQGKLLVAHPMLTDFFARSVIYIYKDDSSGTAGLILNKPTRYTVKELLQESSLEYYGKEHVYKGGPVNEQAIFMLHTDDWYSTSTTQIGRGLALTSDDFMIEKLSIDQTPTRWRMCAGLAGWAYGQLEKELSSKYGWLICDANASIVFAQDGERQWNRALQQCVDQTINQYI